VMHEDLFADRENSPLVISGCGGINKDCEF